MLNEKALRVAFNAAPDEWNCKKSHLEIIEGCITAYLSALLPEDAADLVAEMTSEDFRHEMQHLRSSSEIDRLFQRAASLIQSQAARIAELEDIVSRAQLNMPDHYTNWHSDARALLNGERKG